MTSLGDKFFDPKKSGSSYYQLVAMRNIHKKSKQPTYPGVEKNSPFGDYYYPSLWGYYNLLPTELRNHPFVITVLQGLEKYNYKVNKFIY